MYKLDILIKTNKLLCVKKNAGLFLTPAWVEKGTNPTVGLNYRNPENVHISPNHSYDP